MFGIDILQSNCRSLISNKLLILSTVFADDYYIFYDKSFDLNGKIEDVKYWKGAKYTFMHK